MLARFPTTPAGSCTVTAATALAALRWRLFDVPWGSWNREELPYRRSEPFGEGSSQPVCQSCPLRPPPILLEKRRAGAFVISCLPYQTGFRRSVLFCFVSCFIPPQNNGPGFWVASFPFPGFAARLCYRRWGAKPLIPCLLLVSFPPLPHAPVTRVGWAILFLFPFNLPSFSPPPTSPSTITITNTRPQLLES